MKRIIFHIDQNCYFASVEMISRPELRNVPMAVAGDASVRHGIILAKNEPAKKYGIKTAEAIWQAKAKCPELVLVDAHHKKYEFYSKKIRAMYSEYTDKVEPFGLDECWLDMTGVAKDYDDADWDKLLDQLSFDDMATLINVGGWQTAAISSVGKVATSDCDGPAGLSNFITGAYGTAYPSEVLMAQTWNTELIEEMGEAMGQEYQEVNNYGWYGPAMNTHRNAFAGRNFEYYSEDGVLGGKMAMAETNGAARKGLYPYIKHFALNDQETNRCSFLLTFSSEQAIREIYLKPFEIATKGYTGTSRAVMSSFNWIGTEPSCANAHLLQNVLRGEWGFVGMVETDYDGSYGYMISDHCVRNGNDLMLGFAGAASNQFTDQSATATLAMRNACKNILYTIGNSGYYANGAETSGMDNMTKLFVGIDAGIGVLILALAAIVFGRYFSKKKKAKAA